MTGMLASVRSLDEARLLLHAGADIIDLKEPAGGVLGALPPAVVKEIVIDIDGRLPVSATIGDIDGEPERLLTAIREMAATGVDFVKVGLFDQSESSKLIRVLGDLALEDIRVVLVVFAENDGVRIDLTEVAGTGLSGVMLDTVDKGSGSLLQKVPLECLGQFVEGARRCGLTSGLAGALRAEDVPVLLPLAPDFLGFRGALCKGGREQSICVRRSQIIRALIAEPVREVALAQIRR